MHPSSTPVCALDPANVTLHTANCCRSLPFIAQSSPFISPLANSFNFGKITSCHAEHAQRHPIVIVQRGFFNHATIHDSWFVGMIMFASQFSFSLEKKNSIHITMMWHYLGSLPNKMFSYIWKTFAALEHFTKMLFCHELHLYKITRFQ